MKLIRDSFDRYGREIFPSFVPSFEEAMKMINSAKHGIEAIFFAPLSDRQALNCAVKMNREGCRELALIMVIAELDGILPEGVDDCVADDPESIHNYPWTAERAISRRRLKQLEKRLYHSHKLASIGLLVSGVAHEINNPLTGTIAYTELLNMKVAEEVIRQDLNKIRESAERCRKTLNNLLTFSRQQPASKSLESVNDLLNRTIDLRTYSFLSNNIEVVKDYDRVPTVYADARQLQYVILNILVNAEQAIADSGRPSGRITCTTRSSMTDRGILIRIADNGTGIARESIERIFEPFFSTWPAAIGAGLGLSIARQIVTEHGGTIRAENQKGGGAAFTIELPNGSA